MNILSYEVSTRRGQGHSGEKNAQAQQALDADRWYQLTSVLDGAAGTLTFFIDGQEVASTETSLQPQSITDQSLNTIGRAPYPDPLFKGEVATFRVWDRPLDAQEIETLANEDAQLHTEDHEAAAQRILDDISDLRFDDTTHRLPTFSGNVNWESDDPRVEIVDNVAHVDLPNEAGETAALKAMVTVRGITQTRTIDAELVPAGGSDDAFGYLMVHFVEDSNGYAEKIYLSISRGDNPEQWDILNAGEPILASHLGTTGVRDPYLTQDPNTGTWYIVATDLRVFGGDTGSGQCESWCHWSSQGSTKLNIWESDDLVHWSDQRQIDVRLDADGEPQAELGMAWAPEATWEPNFYGEGEGAFVVYWSSNMYESEDHTGDSYSRVLWAATTDFTQDTWEYGGVMIDTDGNAIDTTVLKNDGNVYRAMKDNSFGDGIYMERSSDDEWWLEDADWETIPTKIGAGWADNKPGGVEGPAGFKRNDSDHWYLYVDVIPTIGYRPMETDDLDAGWEELHSSEFEMAPSTKHGGIVSLNRSEYDAIRTADSQSLVSDTVGPFNFDENATTDEVRAALPSTVEVELAYGRGTVERGVTWDVPDEFERGTTAVRGIVDTIGANNNDWVGEDGDTDWDEANKEPRSATALEVSAQIIVAEADALSMEVADKELILQEHDSNGDYRLFKGQLPEVTVLDGRDSDQIPEGVFWYTLGQAEDFTGPETVSAAHLGWEPAVLQETDHDEVFAGERIETLLSAANDDDGVGLAGQELLAMAFDSIVANGVGIAWNADADVFFTVPNDTEPGIYTSELTLSLWEGEYQSSDAQDQLQEAQITVTAEILDEDDNGNGEEPGDGEDPGEEPGNGDGTDADGDGTPGADDDATAGDDNDIGTGALPRTGAHIAITIALAALLLAAGTTIVRRGRKVESK